MSCMIYKSLTLTFVQTDLFDHVVETWCLAPLDFRIRGFVHQIVPAIFKSRWIGLRTEVPKAWRLTWKSLRAHGWWLDVSVAGGVELRQGDIHSVCLLADWNLFGKIRIIIIGHKYLLQTVLVDWMKSCFLCWNIFLLSQMMFLSWARLRGTRPWSPCHRERDLVYQFVVRVLSSFWLSPQEDPAILQSILRNKSPGAPGSLRRSSPLGPVGWTSKSPEVLSQMGHSFRPWDPGTARFFFDFVHFDDEKMGAWGERTRGEVDTNCKQRKAETFPDTTPDNLIYTAYRYGPDYYGNHWNLDGNECIHVGGPIPAPHSLDPQHQS